MGYIYINVFILIICNYYTDTVFYKIIDINLIKFHDSGTWKNLYRDTYKNITLLKSLLLRRKIRHELSQYIPTLD
jgi:hypothetical protein